MWLALKQIESRQSDVWWYITWLHNDMNILHLPTTGETTKHHTMKCHVSFSYHGSNCTSVIMGSNNGSVARQYVSVDERAIAHKPAALM